MQNIVETLAQLHPAAQVVAVVALAVVAVVAIIGVVKILGGMG